MDKAEFVRTPKAELHVHLEGALDPARALALANESADHPWRGMSPVDLKRALATRNFDEFIERFMEGYRLLRTARHFQIAVEDLCANLEAQGVVYAEILYSPGFYIQRLGRRLTDIHDGIEAGLRAFPKLSPRFVLDTVLNLGFEFMARTLTEVLADRRPFLGGFSVGGGMPDLDMRRFTPLFHRAQEAGLSCVAHAGEVDSAANIEILVRETDVRRIAHGCAAADSPATLALLRRRGVAVDVCLTSNRRTGVVKDVKRSPILRFLEAGVPVSLNTDDPFYFETDLYGEYQTAQRELGFDDDRLRALMQSSLTVPRIAGG